MAIETQSLRLDLGNNKRDKKKLEQLLGDGWAIASSNKRGLLEWDPGKTDLVLTREK